MNNSRLEIIESLVERLRNLYPLQFNKMIKEVKKDVFLDLLTEQLCDLTDEQILTGYRYLSSVEEWMPNVVSIRKICVRSVLKIESREAWLSALHYEKLEGKEKISYFTKQALDKLKSVESVIDMKNQRQQLIFEDCYNSIVDQAIINGQSDHWLLPDKPKKNNVESSWEDNHKYIKPPLEFTKLLRSLGRDSKK